MINEVKCFEVSFEKEMHLTLEVKGFEASCLEVTNIEVMGMVNLEKLGKKISEVVHFGMVNIEAMIPEVKSKMVLETIIEATLFKDLMCLEGLDIEGMGNQGTQTTI